ncbi:hypothetical protein PENSPDRAFT_658439 [Peniophora sp. CONT]|nr:hypothetical protein PENSPDRAFT_658439 [Peniophora sp. CONT]
MTIETTTIDFLPNEVILVVFLWTKAYADLRGDDHFGPPSCVDLSHVSKRWRSLALACQELWTNWPRYGAAIPWTEVCRERSSTASLDLCLLVGSESELEPPTAAVVQLATENFARARSILIRPHSTFDHYMTDLGPFMQTIVQLSHESAPLLENLRLENPDATMHLPFIGAPLLFAAQELPHLRQLSLRGYLVSVSDTMHMSSLCTLNIQFASAWFNADQMIQFLKGMPNLEELTYLYDDSEEGYDDDDDDDDALHSTDKAPSTTHSIRCVPFPRMKRLRLPRRGGFKSGALLFSYCAFAPQTALCFEADTIYLDWDAHLELAANALRDHFAGAITQGQSYDVITVNNRIIKPDISRQTSPSHALPADLSFSISHSPIDIGYPDTVLRSSCELYLSLPIFTGASELHVARDEHSCYGFLKLYPPLPVLRVLVLKRDAIAEVMNHLSNCSHQFPALEVLRLADFDCRATAALIRPNSRDTIARDIVEALYTCLHHGSTKTWRYVEFERFRYGEHVAEKIRSEPELQDLNERVEIRCIDCYD